MKPIRFRKSVRWKEVCALEDVCYREVSLYNPNPDNRAYLLTKALQHLNHIQCLFVNNSPKKFENAPL